MNIRRLVPALCLAAGHAWGQADPVFSPTGLDAAAYGLEQNYPYGPPAGELVLGLVLRGAVNMPLSQYLSTRIWLPMGAEADATWGVDNSGVETAHCCLSAVARDWLRLGMLLADDGVREGREIIPRAWVLEATTPSEPFLAPGVAARTFGYGYQTWAARPSPPVRVDGPPRPGDLRGSGREAGVGAYGGTGCGGTGSGAARTVGVVARTGGCVRLSSPCGDRERGHGRSRSISRNQF
jgi:CubicO group peptidase (beta-lactamase class C family)